MTPPAVAAPPRPRPSAPAARRGVTRRPTARGAGPRPGTGRPRTASSRGTVARPDAGRARSGAVAQAPAGLRLARTIAALPDSRLVDRMVRGRVWIAVLAVGLVGIVFLQISLLKLNTGISRSVETQQTLERQNASLKTELSSLGSGERVKESAAVMGFVSPETGQPRFVDARRASAERAAASIVAPAPIEQLPIGMISSQDGGTGGATSDAVSNQAAPAAAPAPVPEPPVAAPPAPEPEPTPATAPGVGAPAPAPVATTPAPTAAAASSSAGGLSATGQG